MITNDCAFIFHSYVTKIDPITELKECPEGWANYPDCDVALCDYPIPGDSLGFFTGCKGCIYSDPKTSEWYDKCCIKFQWGDGAFTCSDNPDVPIVDPQPPTTGEYDYKFQANVTQNKADVGSPVIFNQPSKEIIIKT